MDTVKTRGHYSDEDERPIVDPREHGGDELLRAVYDGLYSKSVPRDHERETLDAFRLALRKEPPGTGDVVVRVLVAGTSPDRAGAGVGE